MPNSITPCLLKPADFHILLALADGPRHGYAIMKQAEIDSDGRVRLEVGTLYRILARLLDDGLLEEAGDDGRRRDYDLTRSGRRALLAEAQRLASVVEQLRQRRLLPRGEA